MIDYDTQDRTGGMRVARSRGTLSGFLLVLLGLWGALVPFVGPYADYAYTPDATWTWTAGRFWLEVLPGAAAVLGGLMLLVTANRAVALLGAYLACAAGAWFIIGPVLGQLWGGPEGYAGSPVGGTTARVVEQIGFFAGVGAAILFLAAHAAGRLSIRSLRDIRAAQRHDRPTADRDATVEPDRAYQPDTPADRSEDHRNLVAGDNSHDDGTTQPRRR